MALKPKPWWLFFTPRLSWVTWYPCIYYPASSRPNNPAVVAHEQVHLGQQSFGKWRWLAKYVFSRSFRLQQEAEGIRAQVELTNEWLRDALIESYAEQLSSRDYLWAARSTEEARNAILFGNY